MFTAVLLYLHVCVYIYGIFEARMYVCIFNNVYVYDDSIALLISICN